MSDTRGERTSLRRYLQDEPLDLNTATREELAAVRGDRRQPCRSDRVMAREEWPV
jgi:hypothetical protein